MSVNSPVKKEETEDASPKVEDQKFQHYSCSRIAMKLITEKGTKIVFTNFKFITCDEEIIEYLNTEAKGCLKGVIKIGELLTHKEADPMEEVKRKAVEEYKEQQEELIKKRALGQMPNMGNTKTKEALATSVNPMGSNKVTNAAASAE